MTPAQDDRSREGAPAGDGGGGPGGRERPAGPVAAGDPPPPAVAKASSGAVPPTAPPAGGGAGKGTQDPGAGGGPDAAEEVEADFDRLLADTKRERDEYLELAQRTKADFENYRKRVAADVQAAAVRGKSELIREVVPVLDDLERAIEAAGLDPDGESPDGLAHGVLLVFRSLRETLARNGVVALDPQGEKFDPQWHEALSTRPTDGTDSGMVLDVMQKGYRVGDELVRPARVVVSK